MNLRPEFFTTGWIILVVAALFIEGLGLGTGKYENTGTANFRRYLRTTVLGRLFIYPAFMWFNWHLVVVWGKLADYVEQYVRKGDRLCIEGRMEYGSYDRDGITIPTADVVAHELIHLTPKYDGGEGVQDRQYADPDDELPF